MVFRIASSPYTHNQRQTSRIMMLVLLAALPGIAVQSWFFGSSPNSCMADSGIIRSTRRWSAM